MIGTVQNGQTVRVLATFTAGASGSVVGTVTWDVPGGGGSTGGQNTVSTTSTFTSGGGLVAGSCSSTGGLAVDDSVNTHKQVSYAFTTPLSGFPCTPASVQINTGTITGATTVGYWSLTVYSNGALASATLTITDLPTGVTWKKAKLYEVVNGQLGDQVLACLADGTPQGTADICISSQTSYGNKGVQFVVNFLGTGLDPSVTS